MGVAWFEEAEWQRATQRWPDLLEEMPADHAAYRAAVEAKVKAMQPNLRGARLSLVAITIEQIEAQAEADGIEAGSADARGRVAAARTRLGHGVLWPPARNDACWCGSGDKYKRCCGR